MDFAERAELLRRAGLSVIDGAWRGDAPGVRAAWRPVISAAAVPAVTVDITGGAPESEYLAETESQWQKVAEYGSIFSDSGEFLISLGASGAVGSGRDSCDTWALVRRGPGMRVAQTLLPYPEYRDFVVMSLDGEKICEVAEEEHDMWVTLVDLRRYYRMLWWSSSSRYLFRCRTGSRKLTQEERGELIRGADVPVVDATWRGRVPGEEAAWEAVVRGGLAPAAKISAEHLDEVESSWQRIAESASVFSPDGEFLISVGGGVAGYGSWVFARRGPGMRLARALLSHPEYREFTVVSPDGRMACGVTREENQIWITPVDLYECLAMLYSPAHLNSPYLQVPW